MKIGYDQKRIKGIAHKALGLFEKRYRETFNHTPWLIDELREVSFYRGFYNLNKLVAGKFFNVTIFDLENDRLFRVLLTRKATIKIMEVFLRDKKYLDQFLFDGNWQLGTGEFEEVPDWELRRRDGLGLGLLDRLDKERIGIEQDWSRGCPGIRIFRRRSVF